MIYVGYLSPVVLINDTVVGDIDSYELEEFLAEIMSSEFNTVVDDNSLAEVVLSFYFECKLLAIDFISMLCFCLYLSVSLRV